MFCHLMFYGAYKFIYPLQDKGCTISKKKIKVMVSLRKTKQFLKGGPLGL